MPQYRLASVLTGSCAPCKNPDNLRLMLSYGLCPSPPEGVRTLLRSGETTLRRWPF